MSSTRAFTSRVKARSASENGRSAVRAARGRGGLLVARVLHLQHQRLAQRARGPLVRARQISHHRGLGRRQQLRMHVLGGGEIHLGQPLQAGGHAIVGLWGLGHVRSGTWVYVRFGRRWWA